MRGRWSGVALALAALVLGGSAVADAKAPAKKKPTSVVNVFRVEYEATVTWNHHEAQGTMTGEQALSYTIRGTLPNVTFVENALTRNVHGKVATTVEGSASDEVVNPEGTSISCNGKTVNVRGLVGLGTSRKGIWFAPWLSGVGSGTCVADGKPSPMELSVPWPGEANPTMTEGVPSGAQGFAVKFADVDRKQWSREFRIPYEDDKCPGYSASGTIGCTFVATGRFTLTRVSREEEENDTDLIAPIEEPKLNRKRTRATTEVKCAETCDIEALIGVFGGTKKHPKVTPIRSRKQRLKANEATTISLPVDAKARAAAKQGRLVMTLRANGGKTQIYPLI